MSEKSVSGLVPSYIEELQAYTPGKSIEEIRKTFNPSRITKLASNENRWGHSPRVEEALQDKLSEAYNYPDAGSMQLRELLADIYDLKLDNIVLGNGSESLLSIIAKTFFLDHEDAVTAQGTFVGFFVQARIRGIEVNRVPLTPQYRFDVEGLLEAVDENTKMVYIANPNNPTGTYIPESEVRRLREHLPEDTLLVLDSAYTEFVDRPDYTSGMEMVDQYKNTVVTRTFSKIHGLAGVRLGWMYGPAEIVDVIHRVRGPFNVNLPAIEAGVAAIRDRAFLEKSKAHNDRWLDFLIQQIRGLGYEVTDSVCNFVLVHFPDAPGQSAADADRFLAERGLVVRRQSDHVQSPTSMRSRSASLSLWGRNHVRRRSRSKPSVGAVVPMLCRPNSEGSKGSRSRNSSSWANRSCGWRKKSSDFRKRRREAGNECR